MLEDHGCAHSMLKLAHSTQQQLKHVRHSFRILPSASYVVTKQTLCSCLYIHYPWLLTCFLSVKLVFRVCLRYVLEIDLHHYTEIKIGKRKDRFYFQRKASYSHV